MAVEAYFVSTDSPMIAAWYRAKTPEPLHPRNTQRAIATGEENRRSPMGEMILSKVK